MDNILSFIGVIIIFVVILYIADNPHLLTEGQLQKWRRELDKYRNDSE